MKLKFSVIAVICIVFLAGLQTIKAQQTYTIKPNVFVLNYDPVLPSMNNRRLHNVFNWQNPSTLADGLISDYTAMTGGLVQYHIVNFVNMNVFPLKADGFRYTDKDQNTSGSYLYSSAHNAWHQQDGVDYRAIVRNYDLARKVDWGVYDEVWIYGAPYFGYYESRMMGKNSYWCNSNPLQDVTSSKIFVMMGYNYERGVAEELHDYGHRTESIMSHVYGGWDITKSRNDWERFTHNKTQSGDAACGTTHYPPNAKADYDYADTLHVWSSAPDWLNNFPDLKGDSAFINDAAWGGPDYQQNFMMWWFKHMPHVAGTNSHDGITRLNNWWGYLNDFNMYPESGSTLAQGNYSAPASILSVQKLTTADENAFLPKVNHNGRLVWYEKVGDYLQIFSSNADGSNLVQITHNNFQNEDPKINDNNKIVWQAFNGKTYQVFTANADGTDTLQITNNEYNNWHPEINNNDKIVWDGFDGNDFEIFSANVDGTNKVQITNNSTTDFGHPVDDELPQINNKNRVVWMGFHSDNWDIFAANADGSNMFKLSGLSNDDEYPEINDNGIVVYQSKISDTDVEILSVNANSSSNTNKVIYNSGKENWYPQINNGNEIVWMGHNGNNWNVFSAQSNGSNVKQISDSGLDDQYPGISSSGEITWQGYDGKHWQIFLYENDTVYQVTNNNFDNRAPAISYTNIVWHGKSGTGGESQIYASLGKFTDVENSATLPNKFSLSQNYPNPFNPVTNIKFTIPEREKVKLEIFNIEGKSINTLVDGFYSTGQHDVQWFGNNIDGQHVGSGIYYYRLSAGNKVSVKKMIYLK